MADTNENVKEAILEIKERIGMDLSLLGDEWDAVILTTHKIIGYQLSCDVPSMITVDVINRQDFTERPVPNVVIQIGTEVDLGIAGEQYFCFCIVFGHFDIDNKIMTYFTSEEDPQKVLNALEVSAGQSFSGGDRFNFYHGPTGLKKLEKELGITEMEEMEKEDA